MRLAFVIALVLLALPAPADDGGIRVVNPAEFQAELGRHENMLVIVKPVGDLVCTVSQGDS